MTQRVRNATGAFNDRPFENQGASLYASTESTIEYRKIRLVGKGKRNRRKKWIKGSSGNHDIAATSVQKTARVASVTSPTAQFSYSLPASFASSTALFDVRHFKDDVENENDNFRTVAVELDSSRDPVTAILGTATVLTTEIRSGGIVRIRLIYKKDREGTQPILFRATRTAGPSSPADATVAYIDGQRLVEIDTPTLLDSSAYTYTITAENGAVTKDVLTGVTFTADASGPPVPINGATSTV